MPTLKKTTLIFAFIIKALFLIACSSGGVSAPNQLFASFSVSQDTGTAPFSVSFDASNSLDPDGGNSQLTYAWDFGNGDTASGITTNYTFNDAGTFRVILTVTHNGVESASFDRIITVNTPVNFPVASFSVDQSTGSVPLSVNFDASNSMDPNGGNSLLTYAWNFGNGDTATGVTTNYTFNDAGTHTVTLLVTYNGAATASVENFITVNAPDGSVGVDNLQARYSNGQVFITYNEVSNPNQVYYVYREKQAFTDVSSLTPIATLDYGTGVNRYTSAIKPEDLNSLVSDPFSWLSDLQANGYILNIEPFSDVYIMPPFYALQNATEFVLNGSYTTPEKEAVYNLLTQQIRTFIVEDEGQPLPRRTGLLIYTTDLDGIYHYAVTTQPHPDIINGAIMPVSVSETKLDIPGAIQLKPATTDIEGQLTYEFFAWEDFNQWSHSTGYYGHRFNVSYSLSADITGTTAEPLTLLLHSAGDNAYKEPNGFIGGFEAEGIYVVPVDIGHIFSMDPYTKSNTFYTGWFGYEKNGIAVNATEKRIIRYIYFIESDTRFNIDSNRIYATGVSMGGGGSLHTIYHYPHIFAAGAPSVAWVNPQAWSVDIWRQEFGNEITAIPVNSASGPSYWNWQDMLKFVDSTPDFLPPIMHTFNSNDNIIDHSDYADLLQKLDFHKFPYAAEWRTNVHSAFSLTENAHYRRFRKNEAYPAFSNASTSDSIAKLVNPGGIYLDPATGKRNLDLDWSSSLRDLFVGTDDDIVDELDMFSMTFKSISIDSTADVTIRNSQKFFLQPGTQVNWINKNLSDATLAQGVEAANADGLVTIPSMEILSAGNKLTLTYPDGSSAAHQRLIKRFYFPDINPLPIGTIDHANQIIDITVPATVDVTNLKVIVMHTGSSIQPASGAKIDFSTPVQFTVTAPDSSIKTYSINITIR